MKPRTREERIADLRREAAEHEKAWREHFDVSGCRIDSILHRAWAAHENFRRWQKAANDADELERGAA